MIPWHIIQQQKAAIEEVERMNARIPFWKRLRCKITGHKFKWITVSERRHDKVCMKCAVTEEINLKHTPTPDVRQIFAGLVHVINEAEIAEQHSCRERTDLEKYEQAVEKSKNFVPVSGTAVKRRGINMYADKQRDSKVLNMKEWKKKLEGEG
jgi:hypothetical protein